MLGRKLMTFLIDWQWVILVFISPFLLFPSPKRTLVLLAIPILWLVSFLLRKKSAVTPFNLPFLLLMLMLLVSTWATYDIAVSLPKITGVILGMAFFFGLYFLSIARRSILLPLGIYISASSGLSLLSVFGLRQFQKIDVLQPIVQRLPQALVNLPGAEEGFHPNEVAGSLLWVVPLFLSITLLLILRIRKRGSLKVLPYMLLLFLVVLLFLFSTFVFILAQSRTAYLALSLGLLFLFVLFLPRHWRIPAAGILIIALVAFGWWGWQSGFFQSLYEQTTIGGTTNSITTLNGRVEIWSRAIYGVQDFPFTGMGMNTFRKIMPILYPLFSISPDLDIGHAHNEFLQAALDLGIPGLIAFISIYFVSASMLIQIWQRSRYKRLSTQYSGLAAILHSRAGIKAFVAGIAASLLAHALYGLTDAVALGAKPGILFWMLLGLTAGLHHLVCANPPPPSKLNSQTHPQSSMLKTQN